MRIEVILPAWPNRETPGIIRLISKNRDVIIEARCLGKSDNLAAMRNGNKSRDPLQRYGDLPAGEYLAIVEARAMAPLRTYGKWRPLRLRPQRGPALTAQQNGRTGLLQHGGALNAQLTLRPTHGCLRVDEETQEKLLLEIDRAGLTEISYRVQEK